MDSRPTPRTRREPTRCSRRCRTTRAPVTSLDDVDEQDGRAIVGNIFGGNTDQVVSQLGGLGGTSGSLVQKLLPLLAPIVMSWLANKMGQGGLGGMLGGGSGADR